MENQNTNQNQRQKLDFSLDQYDFDYLITGTGLVESLYAAHLQKICRKKCLILDQDDQYSSCIRTLNFKELSEFLNNLNPNFQEQQQVYQKFKQEQEKQENQDNTEEKQEQQEKQNAIQEKNEKNEEKLQDNVQYDQGKLQKKFSFFPVPLSQNTFNRNSDFENFMINDPSNKYTFRRFNIDLQPKVLFSTSLTTDMMSQADMDKYMEFKAIQGIYHFDNIKSKFLLAPSGKSEIYKHKDLGLKEKKDMFNIIHKCIKLYYHHINYEVDQNSLQEFDKDYEIDDKTKNNFEQYKNLVCTEFLQSIGCSKKVMEIFMYTICNFDLDVINWKNSIFKPLIEKECTTIKFLGQIAKFIKSCGVHTSLPYLYTTYGTGDIPQGFSRIAAVFGGQFIINKKINIFNLDITESKNNQETEIKSQENNEEKSQDNNENNEEKSQENNNQQQQDQQEEITKQKVFQLDSNLVSDQLDAKKITIKEGIIIGQEFKNSFLKELLNKDDFEFTQHLNTQNFQENENTVDINLMRINYVTQKVDLEKEEDVIYDKCPPLLYYIPPQNPMINNDHPIQIFQLDSDTNNSAKDYQIFQVKTVINSQYLENKEYQQNLVDLIEKFIEQNIKISTVSGYKVLYSGAFLQNRNVWIKEEEEKSLLLQSKNPELEHLKILLTQQENFETDMDRNFSEFKDNIKNISNEFKPDDYNYFQSIKEMKGEEDYQEQNKQQQQSDDDEDDEGLNKLINQFNTLKTEKIDNKKQENQELEKENQKVENSQPQKEENLDQQQQQKEEENQQENIQQQQNLEQEQKLEKEEKQEE